jgi:hypothetical protein
MDQPSELPRAVELLPADIVLFYDDRFPRDPGSGSEINSVAIVVDQQGALYVDRGAFRRRIVRRLPLHELAKLRNLDFRRSPTLEHRDRIAAYFLRHAHSPEHFEAGLRAFNLGNLHPLLDGSFFPERPTYNSDEQYEAAWQNLKAQLRPLDCIYTTDLSSRVSRFIAWATHGPWSHVAVHMDDGVIWESETSGIRSGPIEIYKGRNFWVAVYRNIQTLDQPRTGAEVEAVVASHPFRKDRYNYRGAIKYGFKSFCGDHSHGLVPNSIIYRGDSFLVAHA